MEHPIIVDTREPTSIETALRSMGVAVQRRELEIGDYASYGDVLGIERKEGDFLNIKDVMMKTDELRKAYQKPYLMVSTSLSSLIDEGVSRHGPVYMTRLLGAISRLAVNGVVPLFCDNPDYFVRILAGIHNKTFDGKDNTPQYTPIRPHAMRPMETSYDRYVHIVEGVEGISRSRAEALIDHFGTPWKLFNSTEEEISKISGIGPETAKAILKNIGRMK